MRGRNGRFAPQNDMVLNNPSLFTPHSSHRKPAFTMAEILIVIAIVGFVCMALMSVIRTAMPDYITVMKRKCYQILEDKVTQLYYDDDLYVRGTKRGFGNLQNIVHNGKTYGGDTKFCELFASTMNKWGGTTCEANKMTFKTADNVYWYLPVTDFSKGYAVVKFDVNGSKKPNCEYDATTCPKPDTFRYYVLGNGKISEHEPKSEEFDYCIKTIITGSGSVLPSAEYCGLKNGTYELTSVPATGWSSPWAGNKKEVTVLDSDEVVYLNFTKEATPEPTTPTSPTVPTTPTEPDEPKERYLNFGVSMRDCPLPDIYMDRSYDFSPDQEIVTYLQHWYPQNYYSVKDGGCVSKAELYINNELMCTLDFEKDTKQIYKSTYVIGTEEPITCKNNIGYGYATGFKIRPSLAFKPKSDNEYHEHVTIKITPRSLFDISQRNFSFTADCYMLCTNEDYWHANGNSGSPTITAKAADAGGWLDINGTKYKILKDWPTLSDGTKRYGRTSNIYYKNDSNILAETAETACREVGGHAANQTQINKFRRETSSVPSSINDSFGCLVYNQKNFGLFGMDAGTYYYDLKDKSEEAVCPSFNSEPDNWSSSSYWWLGPILCVK